MQKKEVKKEIIRFIITIVLTLLISFGVLTKTELVSIVDGLTEVSEVVVDSTETVDSLSIVLPDSVNKSY